MLFVTAKAQLGKESWHWQFGFHSALDFSSGTPVASSSAMNALEGCASISDSNTGALLFYTDGDTVWDKNNNIMPNGTGLIGGNGTSTQSALIIQQPGNSNLYFLITCDAGFYAGTMGVHYSVIDRTLNGGLGDVIVKNKILTPPPATEKLTAVKHCNGKDFWIITHSYNSNAFNAYLFSASGIDTIPVISNAGTIQQGPNNEVGGYLRPSPNGKKLAYAIEYISVFEIFDFDNSTGKVSNPVSVTYPGTIGLNGTHLPYGVAFSPDNSKVYVSDFKGFIFQYDLSSNVPANIIASQTTINTGLYGLGAIQLAPDGKIYLTVYAQKFLSVINNPNAPGFSCNFQTNGVNLLSTDSAAFGLPNFIDMGVILPEYHSYYTGLCSIPTYTLQADTGNTHYQWSTGDTTQTISINNFGNYAVNYTTSKGCSGIDTFFVIQILPPVINNLHDTMVCSNTPVSLNINANYPGATSYLWNDSYDSALHTISTPGLYWVKYTFPDFCIATDSFNFSINSVPFINLGKDTGLCQLSYTIAANTSLPCLWNNGASTNTITVTNSGNYWVTVTNSSGCKNSDTIHVTLYSPPVIPNIVTPNEDGINDYIDFGKYGFTYLEITVFNRWGTKIFESNDSHCIWKPDNVDGTYYWIANYHDCDSSTAATKTLKGFITLVR